MTDFDADEIVAPLHAARFSLFGDHGLVICGLLLALTAAFFPWYVFFNKTQFVARPIVARPSPVTQVTQVAKPVELDPGNADPLFTGAIPANMRKVSAPLSEEPRMRDTRFRLLHIIDGRAMVEDASGIYLVSVGDRLPDSSHVATLEQRANQWVVITDTGRTIGSKKN